MDNKKELEKYKGEFNHIEMSDDAYRKMRMRMDQAKKENRQEAKKKTARAYRQMAMAAAAALTITILPNTSQVMAQTMGDIPVLGNFFKLVTVRTFQYEGDMQNAEVEVAEVQKVAGAFGDTASDTADRSTELINAEIKTITDRLVDEFMVSLKEKGFYDLKIKTATVATTEKYFAVELIVYQTRGDGYDEHHYYTIDLNTGEKVELEDLFRKDSDYRNIIKENIEEQMRRQMEENQSVIYWIDDKIIDFDLSEEIDRAEFYINNDGDLVICFNQTDVAPGYMGAVDFVIERALLEGCFI